MLLSILAAAAVAGQPVELDCHLGGGDEELRWRITLDESAGTLRQQQRGGTYESLDVADFSATLVTVAGATGTLTLDRATMRLTRKVPLAGRFYSGSCAVARSAIVNLARAGGGVSPKSR